MKGIAKDICPKCKNGNVIVWKGVSNIVCEDPYDGMIKILAADNDICCSMFEIRTEKKEKEPCDKISLLQHELEMEKLRMKIHQLEKEKVDHLKGIERLKNKNDKLKNEVNNLKETNENLTKMVERRDRWVKELQSDVYTLQNEVLTIRNIAQKAYDDTNRD